MDIGHDEMNNLQSAYAHMAASESLGLRKGKHRAQSDNKFHVILKLTFCWTIFNGKNCRMAFPDQNVGYV